MKNSFYYNEDWHIFVKMKAAWKPSSPSPGRLEPSSPSPGRLEPLTTRSLLPFAEYFSGNNLLLLLLLLLLLFVVVVVVVFVIVATSVLNSLPFYSPFL